MALQGTIDAFPLTDVLHLLSTSARSGRLVLDGDRGSATLWIEDGHVVGGGPRVAASSPAASLVFELLRYTDGSFVFDAAPSGERPEHRVEATPLAECIASAAALHEEWREVEAVVPSMEHRPRLAPAPPAMPITLDGDEWRLVVAVAQRPTVAELCTDLGVDELAGAAALAGFVSRGLVEVDPPTDAPTVVTAPGAAVAAPTAPVVSPGPTEDVTGPTEHAPGPPSLPSQPSADLDRPPAPETEEFPEHFPIDDLIGTDDPDGSEAWISNGVDLTGDTSSGELVGPSSSETGLPPAGPAERDFAADTSWDELIDDALDAEGSASAPAVGDSADEVLRQMSRLSPQAAEAIAAALNNGSGTDRDGDEQAEGGSSFLGSF